MSNSVLYLFGTPRLEQEGTMVPLRRRKAMALLAYLAITSQPQSRDSLAALLWPELDESRSRGNLRRELSLLRSIIGDEILETDRYHAAVNSTGTLETDVLTFLNLAGASRESTSRLLDLTEAADIYVGEFMDGFHISDSLFFEDWRNLQVVQLQNELTHVLAKIVNIYCAQRKFSEAIPIGRRLVAIDPLHEPNQRKLIRILGWAGQWSSSQSQLDSCIRLLQDDLGVPPEPETLELQKCISTRQLQMPEQIATDQRFVSSTFSRYGDPSVSNLPVRRSGFVGREREINNLAELLDDQTVRIVSIVGTGGIGKTRLALAAVHQQLRYLDQQSEERSNFSDGVYFIELSQLSSTASIISTIAGSLNLQLDRESDYHKLSERQLVAYLKNRNLLLILDNAEHIQEELVRLLPAFDQAPGVRFLITSREPLNLYDEHLVHLQGLEYPSDSNSIHNLERYSPADYPAVMLFEQSARRAAPDFQIDGSNIDAVVAISQLVQGMPLALELAGGWVQLLSPSEILAELESGIGLLETVARDVPSRQQSVRVIFDSSWERLTETDREILSELSIFRGGFSRLAAQKITGVTLPELLRLTNLSLIQCDRTRERYAIHGLLRQYLHERLAEDRKTFVKANDRHSCYFNQRIGEHCLDLFRQNQHGVIEKLRNDYDNFRVAWLWALERKRIDLLATSLDGFGHYFILDGKYELGRNQISEAIEEISRSNLESTDVKFLYAHLLTWQSIFDRLLGDIGSSDNTIDHVLALLNQPQLVANDTRWLRAFVKLQMAGGFFVSADSSGAIYQESMELFVELGDRWGEAMSLAALGYVAFTAEDYDLAYQRYSKAALLLRRVGDRRGVVYLLGRLSSLARYQGKWDVAEKYAREGLALVSETGTHGEIAEALGNLGGTLYFLGEFDSGAKILQQANQLLDELGAAAHRAAIQLRLGLCLKALGSFNQAREHLAESRDLYNSVDQNLTATFLETQISIIDIAEGEFGRAQIRIDEAVKLHRRQNKNVELSWFLYLSGILAWRQGQRSLARDVGVEALQLSLEIGGFIQLHWSLLLSSLVLEEELNNISTIVDAAWIHVLKQPWIAENQAFRLLSNNKLVEVASYQHNSGGLSNPYVTAKKHLELLQQLNVELH